jgi:hypothetical protein
MKMQHRWSRWFDRRPNRQQMYFVRTILLILLITVVGLVISRFG